MKVNGFFSDITALKNIIVKRKDRIMHASPKPIRHDPIKALARVLHPKNNTLVIKSIVNINETTKLIRLMQLSSTIGRLPVFQSGQYMSVSIDFDGFYENRPFFIASPPYKAVPNENSEDVAYVEIVINKKDNNIVNNYIWDNWTVGTEIDAAFPHGKFYYEPLRDSSNLICLVEAIGIVPFYSLICEAAEGGLPINVKIYCKSEDVADILFLEEINNIIKKAPNKFSINLLEETDSFISKINETLDDATKKESSFFISGSEKILEETKNDLLKMKIENRQIRTQLCGAKSNVYENVNFPSESIDKIYTIKIIDGLEKKNIKAKSNETVLAALEKAKITKSTHCRTGECGYCRSKILSGEIFVSDDKDARRIADKTHGYFHPCFSYPVSDLTIDLLK